MEDKIINFTKLGTVKTKTFELTYTDFFQKMGRLIMSDSSRYKVLYNEKTGTFEIIYDGEKYIVYYGKGRLTNRWNKPEIVKELKKLVNLTNTYTEKKEQEDIKAKEKQERLKDIFKRDNGVFESEEEREEYLDYLKKNHKNYRLLSILSDAYDEYSDWLEDSGLDFITYAISIFSTIIALGVAFVLPIKLGVLLLAIHALDVACGWFCKEFYEKYTNLHYLLGVILIAPFKMTSGIVEGLVDKFRDRKKIRLFEKSLKKNGKRNNNKQKVVSKTKEEVKEETKNVKPVMQQILKEFVQIHDKILKIKDSKTKEQFARELLALTNSYKEASQSIEDNNGSFYLMHKNLLDQIVSIEYRVDEVLKQEATVQSTREEFTALIEEVDKKTMGAR